MNTLGQSEYDTQSYTPRERECVGGARLTQANKYFVTKAVLRMPSCGPTHSQPGRLAEGLGKRGEGELPQRASPKTHHPCRLVHLC